MSPFVGYHATRASARATIELDGLLPSRPAPGRPYGVYVYNDHLDHPTWSRGGYLRWGSHHNQDVWRVVYVGPMTEDRYVANAVILLEPAKRNEVTLVTRNS